LVVIKGYATILDGTVRSSGGWNDTHFPPEFPNLASNILQATEDQTEILDKVLVLSKLENNPDTLNETTFNPKQIVQEVHRSLETSAKDKKLDFLLELPSEEISITSDAGCLKNVLVSLLSNAIKYTESGHVCLKLEYPTMDEKNNSPVLLFTVEDTSVGLSPDEIPLIFSRFSQCLPGSTKKAGYGLGLAICKELVTSLGGTIWVESAGDSGTKFHFTISPKVIEERERNSRTSTVSRSPSPYRSLSPANRTMLSPRGIAPLGGEISFIALDILVVDDNSLVRKLLIMQLPKGNHVMEAVDGADAVEKYQKKKPDIIFMDLRMPVLDGFGATEEIRQIEETCHMTRAVIIGISADAREVYALKAKDIGMDDFFAKPVSRHKLEEKIQEIQSSKK
jgi:CheY-like chemotaxis protein/two-component sensor histidine kinase